MLCAASPPRFSGASLRSAVQIHRPDQQADFKARTGADRRREAIAAGEHVGTRMTTANHEGEVGVSSQRVSGTALQRTIAVLGSAVFFVVAPFTLAGLVPWSITGWQLRP